MTNPLGAPLPGNAFISPSFLKDSFARFPFTVAIFPLSTLNVIPLSSVCHYSDEKLVANPVGLPCKCKFIFLLLLSIFILECVFCETLHLSYLEFVETLVFVD